jgi:hypothetical protein
MSVAGLSKHILSMVLGVDRYRGGNCRSSISHRSSYGRGCISHRGGISHRSSNSRSSITKGSCSEDSRLSKCTGHNGTENNLQVIKMLLRFLMSKESG